MDELDSRAAILQQAELLFARQGYSATSIKQIGSAASVNTALLYYYFADKAALYEAVLEKVIGDISAEGRARLTAAPDPDEAVRSIVRLQARTLASRPHLPRLLLREMLDENATSVTPRFLELFAGILEALTSAIEHGQRTGRFRSDVNPRFAAVSTVAQVIYFTILRPLHQLVFRDISTGGGVDDATHGAADGHAGTGDFAGRITPGADGLPDSDEFATRINAFADHAGDFAVAALRGGTHHSRAEPGQ